MLDAKTIDLARKLNAQMASDKEDGEVARRKLNGLLARHGKSMADLPEILGQQRADTAFVDFDWASFKAGAAEHDRARAAAEEAHRTRSGRQADGTYAFYNMANPQDAAASAEKDRKQREDYLRKNAPARAAVIKRYGSEEAAIAPCEREKLLRAGVKQWSKFCPKPHQRWTKSICGYGEAYDIAWGDKPVKRIVDAISNAYPLPDTIEAAIAEEAYWYL